MIFTSHFQVFCTSLRNLYFWVCPMETGVPMPLWATERWRAAGLLGLPLYRWMVYFMEMADDWGNSPILGNLQGWASPERLRFIHFTWRIPWNMGWSWFLEWDFPLNGIKMGDGSRPKKTTMSERILRCLPQRPVECSSLRAPIFHQLADGQPERANIGEDLGKLNDFTYPNIVCTAFYHPQNWLENFDGLKPCLLSHRCKSFTAEESLVYLDPHSCSSQMSNLRHGIQVSRKASLSPCRSLRPITPITPITHAFSVIFSLPTEKELSPACQIWSFLLSISRILQVYLFGDSKNCTITEAWSASNKAVEKVLRPAETRRKMGFVLRGFPVVTIGFNMFKGRMT